MVTDYCVELVNKGTRLDGRDMLEYRDPISVEYGISRNAEGSARVRIGETEVIVGIKLSVETPYPDKPNEGTIMVNAELLPLSSQEYERGPPGMYAIELSRVIDRGIRESRAIDVKELCIEKGEKVWIISIDIISINDAGNLFDAAGLAALAALKDAKFPLYEDGVIDYKKRTDKSIPLKKEPVPVTVFRIGDKFITDPTSREEKSINARLTVAATADGVISALQKGGDTPLTVDEIDEMVGIAIEKSRLLREKL